MSDPISGNNVANNGSQIYNPNQEDDDFEITGAGGIHEQVPSAEDDDFVITEHVQRPSGNEIKKVDLTGSFVVEKFNLPQKTANTLNNIRVAKPSSGIINALGRMILKVVNLFKGVSNSSVLSTPQKLNELRGVKIQSQLPTPKQTNAKPYTMTTEQLSRLAGLGAGTKIEPFAEEGAKNTNLNNVLFGEKSIPTLSDIKQNPEFQDCWFLSSITAVLSTQGPDAILRLFEPSNTPNHVLVRLGENTYDVPLGRIVDGNGNKFGSYSANWVVALENAMLMHIGVSYTNTEGKDVTAEKLKMAYRSPGDGIDALLGCSYLHRVGTRSLPMTSNEVLNLIKTKLEKHLPVVIGHASKATALSDGISPDHAVTVLDVENNNKVVVLDPYGEVKKIPVSSLKNYIVTSAVDYNHHQKVVDANDKADEKRVQEIEAHEDNDKDDF